MEEDELFGLNTSTQPAGDAGSVGIATDTRNLVNRLDTLQRPLNNGSALNGFGFTEDFLFGTSNDSSENTFTQNVLRAATDAIGGEDLQAARSIQDSLDGAFFSDVAAALDGQGQVSNFERQAGLQLSLIHI